MVSFFGLKFGGDRKKAQSKPSARAPEQCVQVTPSMLGDAQQFSPNFSRPNRPLSRPGTSYSSRSSTVPGNWHAPYTLYSMGASAAGATSSMVDLAAPSRPPFVALRQHASDANLRSGQPGNLIASMDRTSLGGGHFVGLPNTANRPPSRRSEWAGPPPDSHLSKDLSSSDRPSTASGAACAGLGVTSSATAAGPGPKSPLGQFGAGFGRRLFKPSSLNGDNLSLNGGVKTDSETPYANRSQPQAPDGYPSPPQSIQSSERSFSPVNADPGTCHRPSNPSALRRVGNTPGVASNATTPTHLPSPAASSLRTSDEQPDGPVIRSVRAKRDTLTFHQPRRRSFTMEVAEDADMIRLSAQQQQQEQQKMELFTGDFAAFDFGESVRRPSITTLQQPSPASLRTLKLGMDGAESPVNNSGLGVLTANETRAPAETGMDVSTSGEPASPKTSKRRGGGGVGAGGPAPAPVTTSCNEQAPTPPTGPLPRPPVACSSSSGRTRSPAPRQPPSNVPRPKSLARPLTISDDARGRAGPPPAATGAHRGNVSASSDVPPPPLSMRSRIRSSSRTRKAPPQPLDTTGSWRRTEQHERDGDESGLRSPYGPPAADGNYVRSGERYEDRPRLSPYARQPMEGDFPLSKGLPRGRRPKRPSAEGRTESLASSNYNDNDSQNYNQNYNGTGTGTDGNATRGRPVEVEEDQSFALPAWDFFDRSNPHRSAIPAPLSPVRGESAASAALLDSPTWSASPLTSAQAPRLPSPTFPSLEKSISSSSENLAKSFGLPSLERPLISPVLGDFSSVLGGGGGIREPGQSSKGPLGEPKMVAPPRLGPVMVPPDIHNNNNNNNNSGSGSNSSGPQGSCRSPMMMDLGFSEPFI